MRSPLESLTASVLFGFSVVLATVLTKSTHPLHILVLSYAVAGLCLAPLALRRPFPLRSLKREFTTVFALRWLLAGILISYGWSLTAGSHATLLVLLEFVFVLLWGHALGKERLHTRRLGLAALVLLGGALFILSAGELGALAIGDLLITMGFALSAYTFFPIQRITQSAPAVSYIALSLLLFPFTLPDPLLLLAYIVTMGIGFTLWAASLRVTPAWLVSAVLTLQPVAGGLLAWLWLHQTLTPVQLGAAALMLIGVYALSRTSPRPR
ncbi:MAG TPA: DMT family transporter [archaeon]|nr:DMT family transporter [archaeon]